MTEIDLVGIGMITGVKGLGGEIKVRPFGGTFSVLPLPVEVMVGPSQPSAVVFRILARHAQGDGLVCSLADCSDRESAEKLRGSLIFIQRSKLPKLEKNEYYHFDLEGMTVLDGQSGDELGIVESVESYPSADAINVKFSDGNTALIPFTPDSVPLVDSNRRTVSLNMSLLEDLI